MIRKVIAWLMVATGVCGTCFGIIGVGIRWAVWSARHSEGTRASMVTPMGHLIGFALTGGIVIVSVVIVIAGIGMIRRSSNQSLQPTCRGSAPPSG
jgi:hypothetical protein